MSIAALSRFTVPLASDQSAQNQGLLMPKLKYRFRISFENFGVSGQTTELTKQVADCTRPNVEFEKQTIDVYNSKINYLGKPTWQPITVRIRDDATGSVTKLVGEQNQKQFDFFEQSSAAAAGDYKFTLRIEMLDGGNGAETYSVLETWECYGCAVVSTNYTDLKYSDAAPVMIEMRIQMDNAVQVGPGAGLGTPGFIQTRGTSAIGS